MGDSYCWEWAVGGSLQVLEAGDNPTASDYRWASVLLRGVQEHVRRRKVGHDLLARLERGEGQGSLKHFMAMEPPYLGQPFSVRNYSGAEAAFPLISSFLQVPMLVVTKTALCENANADWTSGRKEKLVTADSRLGEFSLYTPDEEYEQPLSLAGLRQLLEEPQGCLIIVQHNGSDGVGAHYNCFAAKQEDNILSPVRVAQLVAEVKKQQVRVT